MKKKLFEIKSDCLDIVKRIKEIDADYFVLYDPEENKFQLHHHSLRRTYCLTFPFDVLDERAVLYTLKTRVQNSDELFEEMDELNRKKDEAAYKQAKNDLEECLYDIKDHIKTCL